MSASPAAHPRIARALAAGARAAYDHLGIVLLMSMLWFSLAALLALGGAGLTSLVVPRRSLAAVVWAVLGGGAAVSIGTGPLTAAIFAHARRIVQNDDPLWWELFAQIPRLWRRGLALALFQALVTLVLLVDAGYFLAQERVMWRPVGMLFLYPLLFWWGAALLQWPLAVEREDESLWGVIKKSALLLLDNMGYAAVLMIVIGLLLILCLVTQFGMALFWAGVWAFLLTCAVRELLVKYDLLPASPAATEEMGARES